MVNSGEECFRGLALEHDFSAGPGTAFLRHPSQLYEATLEGLVLFLVVWIYSIKKRPPGAVSGLFLFGYGLARFVVEFFREPDSYLGLQALDLSRGQWLSLPMIITGQGLWIWPAVGKIRNRSCP